MNRKRKLIPTQQKQLEYIWVYPKEDPAWTDQIVQEFKIHPVIAKILVARGFDSLDAINRFLYAKLPDLIDPNLFVDMDKATDRIAKAVQDGEDIMVYGDNDVDGMTGTALLVEFLRSAGGKVHFFIAKRATARNSFILEALPEAREKNCKLLITVDCGVTAAGQIEEIVKNGIDVIVTDHHEPTDKLPHCVATLNPKLVNNTYPNRDLTGVGVAFKLAHALTNTLTAKNVGTPSNIDLKGLLDLVALGTISDMGSLLGENRILVRYGLEHIRKNTRMGVKYLLEICEIEDTAHVGAADIASKLAPRLNSLGRIGDPGKGVELLLIKDDDQKAQDLAIELDINNSERQKIERAVSEQVDELISKNPKILRRRAIVLGSEQWHPGVIAIVATRISKQYNRPTIIMAIENGVGKGSIRSIPEFPLLPVLKEREDLLLNYGGHNFAAGVTVDRTNFDSFTEHFISYADQKLQVHDVMPKLFLDAEVKFEDLTFDFMESMSLLEPYGNENSPPLLYSDAKQAWYPKIIGTQHLKVYLEQNDRMLEGIGFNMAKYKSSLRKKNLKIRAVFSPHVNEFQNKFSIQLIIKDFRIL